MNKFGVFTGFGLLALVALLGGVKMSQFMYMGQQMASMVPPPAAVTSMLVQESQWELAIRSPAELEAKEGVMVSAQLAGNVDQIEFQPGAFVNKGDVLLVQDLSTENAQLAQAIAAADLADKNLKRAKPLLKSRDISDDQYDTFVSQFQQAQAQVESMKAAIAKKTIVAPFSGRLGISDVDVGQFLRAGDAIVTLQNISQLLINFNLPQREIDRVRVGQKVKVFSGVNNENIYEGEVIAISPEIEDVTRNFSVQAKISNPEEKLKPGMFVEVDVVVDDAVPVKMVPTSAILYAAFGDSVFIIEDAEGGGKVVRQTFVRLGQSQGDFVNVIEGLEVGQTIVTTGLFKLFNGQNVVEDNTLSPDFELSPSLKDS